MMLDKVIASAGAAGLVAGLVFFAAPAGAAICKVTDPTGTPLNVRDGPNGVILGTIGNGRDVEVLEHRDDPRGRSWALIRQPGASVAIGWVFREFISCYR